MKKIILTAMCVMGMAVGAQAANEVVYHDYNAVLGTGAEAITLDNACITDTTVESIKPVKICTNLVPVEVPARGEFGGYTDWVCQSYENVRLVRSRTFSKPVCLKSVSNNGEMSGECLQWGTESVTMPDTIKISTITVTGGEAGDNFPGKTSTFTFPRCK